MSAAAQVSKTHFSRLARRPWQLDVILRDLIANTSPARTTLESPASCALSSLVFTGAQAVGSFRFLAFEPSILAYVGQTYTTPECSYFALRALGSLLATARGISRLQ